MIDRLRSTEFPIKGVLAAILVLVLASCDNNQDATTPPTSSFTTTTPEANMTSDALVVEVVFDSPDRPPHLEFSPGAEFRHVYRDSSTGNQIQVIRFRDLDWLVFITPTSFNITVSLAGMPPIDTTLPPLASETVPDTLMFITENDDAYTFNLITGAVSQIDLASQLPQT